MAGRTSSNRETPLLVLSILLGILGLFAYAASKFTPGRWIVILTGLGFIGFLATQVGYATCTRNLRRVLQGVSVSFLAVIAATYLLLFAFVYLFQDRVANQTSSFFQPRRLSDEAAQSLLSADITPLDLPLADVHLRGWLVRNTPDTRSPLLIYFCGSGSESSELIPSMQSLDGWSVALVNYRGFGQSDGSPSHASVLADALVIYDTLTSRADIDPERVVVMGYSLGSGVAVSLAAQRPVAGTILVSPYDHWSLVGVNPSPIFRPIAGILKPYFNSIGLAPDITTPMLCLAGTADTAVPPALSRRLASAWGGEVTMQEYLGENHALLFHANHSWEDIQSFLAGIP